MRQIKPFQYCGRVLPCGLGDGQVIDKDGERGRNRTFNLLIRDKRLHAFCSGRVADIGRLTVGRPYAVISLLVLPIHAPNVCQNCSNAETSSLHR